MALIRGVRSIACRLQRPLAMGQYQVFRRCFSSKSLLEEWTSAVKAIGPADDDHHEQRFAAAWKELLRATKHSTSALTTAELHHFLCSLPTDHVLLDTCYSASAEACLIEFMDELQMRAAELCFDDIEVLLTAIRDLPGRVHLRTQNIFQHLGTESASIPIEQWLRLMQIAEDVYEVPLPTVRAFAKQLASNIDNIDLFDAIAGLYFCARYKVPALASDHRIYDGISEAFTYMLVDDDAEVFRKAALVLAQTSAGKSMWYSKNVRNTLLDNLDLVDWRVISALHQTSGNTFLPRFCAALGTELDDPEKQQHMYPARLVNLLHVVSEMAHLHGWRHCFDVMFATARHSFEQLTPYQQIAVLRAYNNTSKAVAQDYRIDSHAMLRKVSQHFLHIPFDTAVALAQTAVMSGAYVHTIFMGLAAHVVNVQLHQLEPEDVRQVIMAATLCSQVKLWTPRIEEVVVNLIQLYHMQFNAVVAIRCLLTLLIAGSNDTHTIQLLLQRISRFWSGNRIPGSQFKHLTTCFFLLPRTDINLDEYIPPNGRAVIANVSTKKAEPDADMSDVLTRSYDLLERAVSFEDDVEIGQTIVPGVTALITVTNLRLVGLLALHTDTYVDQYGMVQLRAPFAAVKEELGRRGWKVHVFYEDDLGFGNNFQATQNLLAPFIGLGLDPARTQIHIGHAGVKHAVKQHMKKE